jgi:hypothetical protein
MVTAQIDHDLDAQFCQLRAAVIGHLRVIGRPKKHVLGDHTPALGWVGSKVAKIANTFNQDKGGRQ